MHHLLTKTYNALFSSKIGGQKWFVLGAMLDETHLAEKHADYHLLEGHGIAFTNEDISGRSAKTPSK